MNGVETTKQAMIHEAKEEAGIDITDKDLQVVQVMHRNRYGDERIDYFFDCCKWQGEIVNVEHHK
ncbi:MAG: hypothetical protein LBD57_06235 [Endomicrobium sp.]|nr:hypothetical protein [Endomicrobium sp.]